MDTSSWGAAWHPLPTASSRASAAAGWRGVNENKEGSRVPLWMPVARSPLAERLSHRWQQAMQCDDAGKSRGADQAPGRGRERGGARRDSRGDETPGLSPSAWHSPGWPGKASGEGQLGGGVPRCVPARGVGRATLRCPFTPCRAGDLPGAKPSARGPGRGAAPPADPRPRAPTPRGHATENERGTETAAYACARARRGAPPGGRPAARAPPPHAAATKLYIKTKTPAARIPVRSAGPRG